MRILSFFTFLVLFNSFSVAQTVNDDCNKCELNNAYQQSSSFYFEGGNICCDRNFQLILGEEFDGNEIDTNIWATYYLYTDKFTSGVYQYPNSRLHENGGSYYKDENVTVGNGICTLETKIETITFPQVCFKSGCVDKRYFTSGMLMSKQWFENFHRYEIRCKVPSGKYMWPSFWVFGWSTEIDIFEFINSTMPEFSLHKWFGGGAHISYQSGMQNFGDLSSGFHTYAVETDKFFVRWYIDNVLIYTASQFQHLNNIHQFECILEEGQYDRERTFPDCNEPALQVIASSGAAPNAPPKFDGQGILVYNPAFPNYYLIDYIRIYKKVDDDASSGCNLSISGPTALCSRIDTFQYCINGGSMQGGSWELPQGINMYQNPSLTINKKTVLVNGIETIISDTIVHENCIKVIAQGFYQGGTVKFKVPETCSFLKGDVLTKKLAFGLPKPIISYDLNVSCDFATVCLENYEDYSEVWFSEGEGLKNCRRFKVSFIKNSEYWFFIKVKNECGEKLYPIRIDGRRCVELPINDNLISIIPNPAKDQFNILLDDSLQLSETDKIISGQIFNINSGNFMHSFNLNFEKEITINSMNYPNGEYLLLLKDNSNTYYSKRIIINKD